MLRIYCLLLCILSLAACGKARRYGDAGGVPVAFHVTLDKAFVSGMQNRQGRVGVGVGGTVSSGGHSSIGTGIGLGFSATTVYLLGGDGAGQAQVFRKEITWGENAFTVPLAKGRTLYLTVQVQGGREGWEAIGSVVVPADEKPTVTIGLSDAGPRISAAP
jgi:hypothetical protein